MEKEDAMKNKTAVKDQKKRRDGITDNEHRDLFEQAKSYAYDYMDSVYERAVFPTEDAINHLDIFNEPLPEQPCDPSEILRLLHEYGSPATIAQTGGRYFGFVNGGAIPTAVAAKWLSDVSDIPRSLITIFLI